MFYAPSMTVVRHDLVDAHRASRRHVASPGACLPGTQRIRLAEIARDAYVEAEPSPPWVRRFPEATENLAYRLARHAGTFSVDIYNRAIAEGMSPLVWVEVVGVVIGTVPVVAFARAIGSDSPTLPPPIDGDPSGRVAPELVDASLSWVPVAAPADQTPAVVQALSALPDEWANLWRLAGAQYMTDRQMADPTWTRGTLSRPQMELVAGRISKLRECFY